MRWVIWVCVMVAMAGGCARVREDPGQGFIEVKVGEPCAAGRPVRLLLAVHNESRSGFSYWCGGPGNFPGAEVVEATVRREEEGEARRVELSNGQYMMGSGTIRVIAPQEAMAFQVVLPPMEKGRYRVRVFGGTWRLVGGEAGFVVSEDASTRSVYEWELAERIRRGDLVAAHVAIRWPEKTQTAALMKLMEDGDERVAIRAMWVMHRMREWPAEMGDAVAKGLGRELSADKASDVRARGWASFAPRVNTVEVVRAVGALARRDFAEATRAALVQEIGLMTIPEARESLAGFLTDPERRVTLAAAVALSRRHDEAALPVLLKLARDVVPGGNSGDAMYALAEYPGSKDAMQAIDAGMKDERTRSDAKRAREKMRGTGKEVTR